MTDLADARLEREIRKALDACLHEKNARRYRTLWLRLTSLIAQRSPKKIVSMEKKRGL
jgi:hypothetical protein